MKRTKASSLALQLDKAVPKLADVAPDFHIPEFRNDEEELAWLEKNHERLARLAEKHGAFVRFVQREPTQQISIRIPVRDIERAKKIAAKVQESYQTILKRAIRSGLDVGV